MADLLRGKEVVDRLNENMAKEAEALIQKGTIPTLGIVRVGARPDDLAYEKGALSRAEKVGVRVKQYLFDEDVAEDVLIACIHQINQDDQVHGVLMFRPLPGHMDDQRVRNALIPEKDIDGITDGSLAGVFSDTDQGYPPCTASACMEILNHFGIDLTGKKAVVVGRSLVVGKPAAMMLLKKNATVTICHSKTANIEAICKAADILIVATGKAKQVGAGYCSENQIIIDVGINMDETGKLCGDVDIEQVAPVVKAITPVPGGVGTVTTSMLMKHVLAAAQKQIDAE